MLADARQVRLDSIADNPGVPCDQLDRFDVQFLENLVFMPGKCIGGLVIRDTYKQS